MELLKRLRFFRKNGAIGAGTEIKGIRESFIPHKKSYN